MTEDGIDPVDATDGSEVGLGAEDWLVEIGAADDSWLVG